MELLCRQAGSSRTARALVERNLASELDCHTIEAYMGHLVLIAKAVPAPLLGLFVLNSVTRAKESGEREELKVMLSKMIEIQAVPDTGSPKILPPQTCCDSVSHAQLIELTRTSHLLRMCWCSTRPRASRESGLARCWRHTPCSQVHLRQRRQDDHNHLQIC